MSFSGSGVTELAHAVRTTLLSFTPTNAFTLRIVPFDSGQVCEVPQLGRPIYLHGWAIVDLDTAVLDASTELAIARSSLTDLLASEVVEASHGPGNGNGSIVHVFHRIVPNTAGARYNLYSGSSNGAAVTIFGQAHAHAHLLAFC